MTKSEIRDIVSKFSSTYNTREDIVRMIRQSTFEELLDYIYDASNTLTEIKNGLEIEHELTKFERRS